MNFYKRFMGDYQRDTGHLAMIEHGAYTLLLDAYYATGKPLPTDNNILYRLVRAFSVDEQQAVYAVLLQFWTKTGDGWINARASIEIGKAAVQAETNRRIAEEREEKRRLAASSDDQSTNRSTNRSTNGEPSHSHSHSHSQTPLPQPKPDNTTCAESLPRSTPNADEIIRLPLAKNGDEAIITQPQIIEWTEAYPGIDVTQQLRHMRQWLLANGTKRKTRRGIARFIVSWLSKAQDSPRSATGGGLRPVDNSAAVDEAIERHRERERTIDG